MGGGGPLARLRRVAYEVSGWGVGEAWLVDGRVVEHSAPQPGIAPVGADGDPLGDRFAAYFAGARDDFADLDVDLDWCTPFQRELSAALRAVPYGEVVTYGELAALAGRPGAHRAAGSFCAGNRFALIVPCHRVVAAGGPGGYGSLGLAYKRRLLELEGVAL